MLNITVMFFLCGISLLHVAVGQSISNAATGAVANQALNSIPSSDLNVANLITPSNAGNTVVTLANGNINNLAVGTVANPNIVNTNINPNQINNLVYANNFADAGIGINNFAKTNLGGLKPVATSNLGAATNPNNINANVNPKQINSLAYANNLANTGIIGATNFAQANLGGLKPGVAPSNAFGTGNSINVPYGGVGTGDVSVAGDFDVKGATQIKGQVPVKGGVQFNGVVPAKGTVTIAAKCGCPGIIDDRCSNKLRYNN